MAKSLIGTSGWNYKHWHRGKFYPTELNPPQWLPFFSQQFETVEINSSFYRLPSEAAFQHWRSQVPPRFMFAVKASRFLTHIKRLKDPKVPLGLFFSRATHLKDRLGPFCFSCRRNSIWIWIALTRSSSSETLHDEVRPSIRFRSSEFNLADPVRL